MSAEVKDDGHTSGGAFRWGELMSKEIARESGYAAAEEFVRDLRRKWKISNSYLAKKRYDGAKGIIKAKSVNYSYPEGDIDVLMMTQNDWSNTGYRFSKCLESLGLKVVFIKGLKHPYNYPAQGDIDLALAKKPSMTSPVVVRPDGPGAKRIRDLISRSRVVHFLASTYIDVGADLSDKFVVVQHGGTTFRQAPKKSNAVFNKFVNATIIQCPDLLSLGAKNEHLIYYPVQTDLLTPNYDKMGRKILIGHFPSNPVVKGTREILRVINELEKHPRLRTRFEYIGSREAYAKTDRVSWEDHLDRVSKCDILIETLNTTQEGKAFGEWGNTAIEAAALGKIVVTNSLQKRLYKEQYGGCALNIANTRCNLKRTLKNLLLLNDEQIKQKKEKTRRWVVENHSMLANSKRLWDKVYCEFFPEMEEEIRSKFWK